MPTNIKATREGLVANRTASGYVIDTVVPFVALPSTKALGKFVKVSSHATGKSCLAICLDVGPFNVSDSDYVFGAARPLAESGVSVSGNGTNHAGIDLGERVWHELGMTDNSLVDWEFI